MGNRSVVEAKYHGKADVKVKNKVNVIGNINVNTKIVTNIPGNGTVTIKTNPDENTTIKIKVRRRTRIIRRA